MIIVDVGGEGGVENLVYWIQLYTIIDHIEGGNCECLLREAGERP